ncbi:hypothetical protein JCM11251_003797 [Rhodosporidiobolus azoricus]
MAVRPALQGSYTNVIVKEWDTLPLDFQERPTQSQERTILDMERQVETAYDIMKGEVEAAPYIEDFFNMRWFLRDLASLHGPGGPTSVQQQLQLLVQQQAQLLAGQADLRKEMAKANNLAYNDRQSRLTAIYPLRPIPNANLSFPHPHPLDPVGDPATLALAPLTTNTVVTTLPAAPLGVYLAFYGLAATGNLVTDQNNLIDHLCGS